MQLDTENEMQDMETVKFTEHIVSDADSLYGLSLQYNIPIEILRKFNNLSTDEIYFCKVIKIPESSKFHVYFSNNRLQLLARKYQFGGIRKK